MRLILTIALIVITILGFLEFKKLSNRIDSMISNIDSISSPYNDMNDNEVEIHNKIKFFVTEGNEILSKKFLLWFMKQYHNIDICDDYRLQIIDNDINMFDIKKLMSIKIKKNTYSLESE